MDSANAVHRPGGTGNPDRSNIMQKTIITLREAAQIAKSFGLVKGAGKYNGDTFWTRPGDRAIITRRQLAEMAGRA
jgi:hypothetical protein